jgi:hypothetical protein
MMHVAGAKLMREYIAVLLLSPRQRRQKICLMRVTSHVSWEPQEEGMMSAAVSFPSV